MKGRFTAHQRDRAVAVRGDECGCSDRLEELAKARRARWREENREAIDAYNRHVDAHGTFADRIRSFF